MNFFVENQTNKNIPNINYDGVSSGDFAMTNTRRNTSLVNDGLEGFRISNNYAPAKNDPQIKYVKLDYITPPNGGFVGLKISPDSKTLVYIAVNNVPNYGTRAFFSVPISGPSSSKVKISPDIVSNANNQTLSTHLKISKDSFYVCYMEDPLSDFNPTLLTSTPITGPSTDAMTLANVTLLKDFRIFPDSLECIYYGIVDTKVELYSTSIIHSTQNKLNPTFDGDVINFLQSHNNNFIVYKADASNDTSFKIFKKDIFGGTNTQINLTGSVYGSDASLSNVDQDINVDTSYLISKDDNYVVYQTDGTLLYSFNTNTNTNVLLGNAVTGFLLSSDSSYVAYTSTTSGTTELYSVPIGGGSSIKINAPVVMGVDEAEISADSKKVVYVADTTPPFFEMSSVNPDGTGTIAYDIIPNLFFISPDSKYIVFTDSLSNLYSVPIAGGNPVKLSSFSCTNIKMSGKRIFYFTGNVLHQLYTTNIDGTSNEINLSRDIGNVYLYDVSKDGKKVAYCSFLEGKLYSAIFK